ncbi:amidase domain-containing protein [Aureibacillus halotolerans]|uniref:Putative amidase-like protein n=1 Tax=Aureibacillus halotolerans TaxID=1508390 RepID=A0A4R6TTW2_9BACI|nr:amidase domain-containing protein [Aureibacillus halotolerans]TDQ35433.1 putative amidase-like protein [Aureibacillus halotolerans]
MSDDLQALWRQRLSYLVHSGSALTDRHAAPFIAMKDSFQRRGMKIVKAEAVAKPLVEENHDHRMYFCHLSLMYQGKEGMLYKEERLQERVFDENGDWEHYRVEEEQPVLSPGSEDIDSRDPHESTRFSYNRREAVRYADYWWNSYNPAYREFEVDCTNYISQCLRAGGAPMRGQPNRGKGWWYSGSSWSYSWAVAHSLRWYLSGSTAGLQGEEVASPLDLQLGDVICYDFEGDGRWNHNTIVTAFDENGEPLVNAHTSNSRMRYWAYEDSTAYTPNIQYKFFHIKG